MEIIKTAEGWWTTELSSLVVEKGGVQTGPFGSQLHQRDYVDDGTPIITVEHLGDNKILHDDPPCVSDSDKDRLSKYSLRSGDIVFSRVGSVDRRALVRDAEDGWLFSGRCLRVRIQPEKIDSAFLSYYLGHESVKKYIRAVAVGATMPSINTKILSQLPVSYPPKLEDQKAIAHILGTLDDKIEINQRMNQTLEDIAKAIFKSWFVDFDPVRAKMEGRPTGLPPEIDELFPDELVDSEIGEIPKGWVLASIDEACEKVYSGGTPSTKVPKYWGGSHGWLSSGETGSRFIIDTEKKITEAGVENSSTKMAQRFDTVIASAGQGKTRGQTSLLLLNTYVNQSVVTLSAKTEIGALLLFFNLSRRYEEFRRYSDSSSSRGSLTTTLLKELPFVTPTEKLTSLFEKTTLPMVEKIEFNLKENKVLSELRDTLLPKLISGEVRIPDAEKFLEEAGI